MSHEEQEQGQLAHRLSQRRRRNLLRIERVSADLTQSDLAALAHVSRQTINAIEAGRRTPQIATAVALAQALGYTDPALLFPEHFTPLPAGMSGEAPAPAAATSLAAAGGLADTEGER